MTLLRLDQIRLDSRSHGSALRWILSVYYQPRTVSIAEKKLSRRQQITCVLRIYLHALPYLVLITALARLLLFGVLGLPNIITLAFGAAEGVLAVGLAAGLIFSLSDGLTSGLGFGLACGFASALTPGLALCLVSGHAVGLGFGLAFGLTLNPVFGLIFSIEDSFAAGLAIGLTGSLAIGLTGGLVRGLAAGLGVGLSVGLAAGFAFAFSLLRLYYLPFHWLWLWLWPSTQEEIYRFHPVAWDEACQFPFPGLDRLLVAYAEYDSIKGEHEIDRLIDDYPSQRGEALKARAILVARGAASTIDFVRLDEILGSLPDGKKGFLAETPELRGRVHEICALQARLDTLDRPFLREPFAALLVKEIETFEQQIAGFKPPLATEFRKAARQWLVIARRQLDVARTAATREPTRQVFRAGDPVNREREAFVLRGVIMGDIERQAMLATGCPGLLVYGRRRMGKSTLLRNLEGLLPPRVNVVSLSMQEARAFTSLPDLVRLIAQRVTAAVPGSTKPTADLKGLQIFLDSTQRLLETGDHRLLLGIDEYENLDSKIGENVLPEDLLAVLRESIQTHRRIIWTFAGSHGIDELVHASWTSYLVSARTVEVTPFELAETRLLLTEPLKHSTLWRDAGTERPRFEPGFWGDGGIERIHVEAGGWPHLVQLVAETVVDLVNDSGGAAVDDALLERALDRAVIRGNNVFLELLERESRLPGEWDYLRVFRNAEEQPLPVDEALDRSLRRRRLVVEEKDRYHLRVPLMARWLRERI